MSHPRTRLSAIADRRHHQTNLPHTATTSIGSSQGSGQQSALRSESMLRANPSNPDDLRPTSTTHSLSQPPGPSWHSGDVPGYPIPGHPSFHDSQHSAALLMGNKHGMPGENVRSHAPPPSAAPGNPDRESVDRTSRPKEESGSGGGGGGSASNASSGVGSDSPEKNSPGLVRSSETAEWLAQIGSGQLHHGRPVVTVGVTLPSNSITQGIASSTVSSADLQHYYSPKDSSVYTSAALGPVSVPSLQYSTHVAPSRVHLTTVPSYGPYLNPYALPYVGYPHSALTPGIESYSAMLASMGNQVQQAQAHLPTSPFLTPGLAIPSPYTLGIQGLNPTSKSTLPESASSAVAYIGGHVIPSPALLPTSHAISTGILSTGGLGGGHIPGVSIKTEDRQEHSQSKELEQFRQEQELKRYMDSGVKHGAPREARVSPFERRTSPAGSISDQVKTGRDSGIPESPRQPGMELSPSGKADSSRQQYYREIGIGTVKMESGNGHTAQTYLSSSRPEVHGLHRKHTHGPDGIQTHTVGKPSVISRTPPIASPIPSTLHMTSRLISSRQQQHSPQTGLVLSPTPQVRPTPSITTSLQPTTQHQGTAIQQEFTPPAQTRPEVHRFTGTVQDNQEKRSSSSDQSVEGRHFSQSPVTNVPSYFTRGSIIQLANGELRRVEDLRTEDFVQSAELTEGLKIDSSTVLRVEEDHRRGVAHIGFLVGEQKAQVTVEAPMEHPFFVFGQGWSAVQPERSLKSYGLACHPLAVGDVCVSLTVKENGRQPSLRKERVMESFHISSRDIATRGEPEAKRIRTEISLRQSPVEKAPPAQSAYHRQTTEGTLLSNHIPGHPGHIISHSSFQAAGVPVLGSGSAGDHSAAPPLGKVIERVDIDKNANTVLVQTNVLTSAASSGKESPHVKLSEQQIARPLKRRWSDPVKAADPSPAKESLPAPVHPEMLIKQTGGH